MKGKKKTEAQSDIKLKKSRQRIADGGKSDSSEKNSRLHQTAEQAQRTVQRLSALIANLPGGIIVETPQRTILQVNQKFCDLFGINAPPEALQGADCREAAQQVKHLFKDSEGFVKRIDDILAAGKSVKNEELQLRDGRFFERDYVPMEVAPGQIEHLWHYRDVSERRRAEEALRVSEEKFRKAFTTSPDSININRLEDGMYVSINDGFTKITGYTESDVIGKTSLEINIWVNPADREKLVDGLRKYGQVKNLEAQFRMKDGRIVYGLMSAAVITLDGVPHIISITRDLTERKRAEEQLLRRDALLEAVNFAAEIFLKSADWREDAQKVLAKIGSTAGVSRVYIFENYLGNDKELLTSQRFEWTAEGITPQIDEPALQGFPYLAGGMDRWVDLMSQGKEIIGLVSEFPDSEKEVLSAQDIQSILAIPVMVEGNWWGFIGFADCVQEREWSAAEVELLKTITDMLSDAIRNQRAEQALQKSEAKYRSIFENSAEGIYQSTPQGQLITVNPALVKMFGYKKAEEMLAIEDTSRLYWDETERKQLIKLADCNGFLKNVEVKMKRADGSPLWALINDRAVKDSKGQTLYYEGMLLDITERKQAEQALRQSERKYKELFRLFRTIADNMTDMLWAKDMNKRYIFANQAICKNLLNARDTDEPIGKDDLFFANREREAHPENPQWHTFGEICRDSDQVIIDTKEAHQFDEFGNVKGKFLFLDVHKSPLLDENGNMIGIVGSARDVTREKEIQRRLQESEESYRTLVEASPLAIVVHSEGKILFANKAAMKIVGAQSEDQLLGRPVMDFVHPDHREVVRKRIQNIYERKEAAAPTMEEKFIRLDGTVTDVEVTAAMISFEGKSASQVIIHDISDRKQAERKLVQSEASYRGLFNNATDAIYVQDEEGRFIEVNEGAVKMYGYPREFFIGKTLEFLSAPDKNDLHEVAKHIEKAFNGQPQQFEFWGRRSNGEVFPKIVRLQRANYFGKQVVIAFALDITERVQAERQLKKELQEKEILLRELHHRTRNNMQVICSLLHLQASRTRDRNLKNAFKKIETQIRSMALVHQHLLSSKDLSHLNLKDYLETLVIYLKRSYIELAKNISIHRDMKDVNVLIDTAIPLGLVITELVTNAFKHGFPDAQKGTIKLSLFRNEKKNIIVELSDNGIGFPKGFDITKDVNLGLATAIELVERQLEGKIDFKSENGLHWKIVIEKEVYKPRV